MLDSRSHWVKFNDDNNEADNNDASNYNHRMMVTEKEQKPEGES